MITGKQAYQFSRHAAVAVLACMLILLSDAASSETRIIELNNPTDPPLTTHQQDGFLDRIAIEAFRRQGLTLHLVKLPAERGLLNANAGLEDGDLNRIAGLDAQYPNLIRVPEKMMDMDFVVFTKNASISATWEALRARPVGFIKGWKIFENNLATAPYVTTADDPEQLFRLLAMGRIEVALYDRWMGLALIKQMRINDVDVIEPPLASREMFIYLHKKHAELAPKLSQTLKILKREGFYQRVYRETLQPYIFRKNR